MTGHIAFIAGATGYTGREVARQLAAARVRTVAHVRPDSARLAHWREHFASSGAAVAATPWQAAAMNATLSTLAPTIVFGLLGTTRARAKAAAKAGGDAAAAGYEAIDHDLTILLLQAARACGSTPRFVYLSSLGAGPNARGAYLQVRARVEAGVQASGLPWTIARPSFISGSDRDDDRMGERIGASVVDGVLGLAAGLGMRGPSQKWASHGNVDLAAGLIRCALAPDWQARIAEAADLRQTRAR